MYRRHILSRVPYLRENGRAEAASPALLAEPWEQDCPVGRCDICGSGQNTQQKTKTTNGS